MLSVRVLDIPKRHSWAVVLASLLWYNSVVGSYLSFRAGQTPRLLVFIQDFGNHRMRELKDFGHSPQTAIRMRLTIPDDVCIASLIASHSLILAVTLYKAAEDITRKIA